MHGARLVLCLAVSLLGVGECFLAPGLLNSRRGHNSVLMTAEPLATSSEALLIENEELRQKVLMLEDTIERTGGCASRSWAVGGLNHYSLGPPG